MYFKRELFRLPSILQCTGTGSASIAELRCHVTLDVMHAIADMPLRACSQVTVEFSMELTTDHFVLWTIITFIWRYPEKLLIVRDVMGQHESGHWRRSNFENIQDARLRSRSAALKQIGQTEHVRWRKLLVNFLCMSHFTPAQWVGRNTCNLLICCRLFFQSFRLIKLK
jgi:hypothetical protein